MTETRCGSISLKQSRFDIRGCLPPRILLISKNGSRTLKRLIQDINVSLSLEQILMFTSYEADIEEFESLVDDIYLDGTEGDILKLFCTEQKYKNTCRVPDSSLLIFNNNIRMLKDLSGDDMNHTWLRENRKHYNVAQIYRIRHPTNIPNKLRMYFDYVLMDSDYELKDRKQIYEMYFRVIPSFEIFTDICSTTFDQPDVKIDFTEATEKIVREQLTDIFHKDLADTIIQYCEELTCNGLGIENREFGIGSIFKYKKTKNQCN